MQVLCMTGLHNDIEYFIPVFLQTAFKMFSKYKDFNGLSNILEPSNTDSFF